MASGRIRGGWILWSVWNGAQQVESDAWNDIQTMFGVGVDPKLLPNVCITMVVILNGKYR